MAKASEAQLRANYKYRARNTTQFRVELNLKTDADIIKALEESGNKQGYIKALVRQDIAQKQQS